MAREFPVSAVGAFGDLGGEIITLEWVPDPSVVEGAILRVANYFDDLAKPLIAAAAIARADMRARFETETTPDGGTWAPLDPEYLVRKQSLGANEGILKRWGDLENAATSSEAFLVRGNDLFFTTNGLPFYWRWMQEGTGEGGVNAGAHADFRERVRASKGLVEDTGGAHESLGIGRGKATPPRPYIGISADAEEQIFEVFDLWFAEGVSISISRAGTVQEHISGRFGKKLYPDYSSLVGG